VPPFTRYLPNPPEWEDEICAYKAMLEVLGPSVPPLLEDVRPERPANRGNLPTPRFAATTPPKSSLSPEFVVTGAGAAHIFDANQISLAAAKKLVRACRDWAAAKGATMSAYVLDNAGEMVHMERMDGQVSSDMHTALLGAQTALRLREPTSIRGTQMLNAGRAAPRNTSPNMFNFYLAAGGIPIVVDGQMIGAVGVSGVDGGQDENCAIEGLKAAFGDHATLPVYGPAGPGAGRAPAPGRTALNAPGACTILYNRRGRGCSNEAETPADAGLLAQRAVVTSRRTKNRQILILPGKATGASKNLLE
jgi:glc operon protein GlcG